MSTDTVRGRGWLGAASLWGLGLVLVGPGQDWQRVAGVLSLVACYLVAFVVENFR